MSGLGSHRAKDRRGIATVEFALVAPVLLTLLGGVTDFGLMMSGKSQLANGLAQGVQYALLQGASVSAATVQDVVRNGSGRSGLSASVDVLVTGPACYCTSGQPAALAASSTPLSAGHTCTSTCPPSGSPSGTYLILSASYVYEPLMPLYSRLANMTVTESVTVRLQ
jgi:Flp pilus assembly protein TadG